MTTDQSREAFEAEWAKQHWPDPSCFWKEDAWIFWQAARQAEREAVLEEAAQEVDKAYQLASDTERNAWNTGNVEVQRSRSIVMEYLGDVRRAIHALKAPAAKETK